MGYVNPLEGISLPWKFGSRDFRFLGPDAPDVEIPEFSPRDKGRGWEDKGMLVGRVASWFSKKKDVYNDNAVH